VATDGGDLDVAAGAEHHRTTPYPTGSYVADRVDDASLATDVFHVDFADPLSVKAAADRLGPQRTTDFLDEGVTADLFDGRSKLYFHGLEVAGHSVKRHRTGALDSEGPRDFATLYHTNPFEARIASDSIAKRERANAPDAGVTRHTTQHDGSRYIFDLELPGALRDFKRNPGRQMNGGTGEQRNFRACAVTFDEGFETAFNLDRRLATTHQRQISVSASDLQ
jgi:hypothetical protein